MEVYESPLHSLMSGSWVQPGHMFDGYLVITDSAGQPQLFYDVSGEERVRVIARVAIFFVAGIVCLLVTLEAGKQVRGKKEIQ